MPEFSMPPTSTNRYNSLSLHDLLEDELIILPSFAEESRANLDVWAEIRSNRLRDVVEVVNITSDSISVRGNGHNNETIYLSDSVAVASIFNGRRVLLDVSGLPYHVWTPILKALYCTNTLTRVVYVEPNEYKPHKSPASDSLFDLSKEFLGLSPLPGMAQLLGPEDENRCLFVPLLGFEGNRPRSLAYQIDPEPKKVIPIVGLPGFQIEYPTYTLVCNRDLLEEFQAFSDIHFARASCPYEAYATLKSIKRYYSDHYMYIAPVGTKPHGIGAVLYSIANPDDTEIMFDHPIKKDGRTAGQGLVHIYDFGGFDEYRS
ncbi:hypothetical protein KO507_11615 [Gilvimarinus agarilyticus]|uniref:hypothetical protein n=1 Tax=Gilvimarinus sp. 2_MG-2023 TaxID=3062666 RepID=UPI001C09300E|nr:hypothetical protein [Gilvimarinus sp. 2_MG-2023]MBU2886411.1 hypothetical protein [Gilvimarinus agarilyticus]MDO6571092.1 hypothetical protein [Gilvimarinus sp. 2_MG-2023]